MFADSSTEIVTSIAQMTFKQDADAVQVNFVSVDLAMVGMDGVTYYWTMDVGFIDPVTY